MDSLLTKKQAVKFTGLDSKTFDNYFKNAKEFSCLPRKNGRGRYFFKKSELESWLKDYRWRTVKLDIDDYVLCLDFALAQHFKGYVLSDWGTARQREFGQKITNWVKGQLAEVAVQKFFKREFNFDIELDFQIYNEIVPQDIIGVIKKGKKRKPKLGVGIKSSKPKNAYLILGENEIKLPERRSEVYIFCRPDVPDDHLLRITKDKIVEIVRNQQHYSMYKDKMPVFENMSCEIAGWCRINELKEVKEIPGQKFENGVRFVRRTGELYRNKNDWQELISRL